MTRARHETQIIRNSTTFGDEFEKAVHRTIARHRGLSFFTEDQIAEIRAEMIDREWSRHKFRREQRKQALALKNKDVA